jgi:hypothetical protein
MAEEPRRENDQQGAGRDDRTGRSAAAARIQHQAQWVDLQIQQAVERGDFDELPGYGKPLESLGSDHDPDWWIKKLIEREHITGVLPPALQLRKDDAELDALLDGISAESDARRELEDFNERVRKALYQPLGGPPLVTQQRDVEAELDAWRVRRAARAAALPPAPEPQPRRRRWFGRR